MTKENTGSIPIEDRFYDFVTKDFPDFRKETGERLTRGETQMTGVNGRLKKIETKLSVPPIKETNGSTIKRLFSQYKYWIAIALLGLGIWIGSRGDTEGTIRMLATMSDAVEQIGLKVTEIEKIKTEPVRIPVPVSSECYSEEMTEAVEQ